VKEAAARAEGEARAAEAAERDLVAVRSLAKRGQKEAALAEQVAQEGGGRRTALYYDVDVDDAGEIGMGLAEELEKLEPTGKGNPEVKLRVRRGAQLTQLRELRGGHCKGKLEGAGAGVEWIMWGGGEHIEQLRAAEKGEVELLGRLQLNRFAGRQTPQFVIEDVHVPGLV